MNAIAQNVETRLLALGQKFKEQPVTVPPAEQSTSAKAREAEILREAGLPKRHDRAVGVLDTEWQRKLNTLTESLGSGFLRALVGIQGVGKTQMGVSLCHASARLGRSCLFTTAMDFFVDLRASYRDEAKRDESATLKMFTRPKLLVIDEMDERSENAWENRMLFHLINKRYQSLTDTLLISRRSRDEFLQSLGESIQSRLQETGACTLCEWKSWRGK